ncbi:MAG: hypothetical protein MUE49_15170, partial [Rhodospirillales bacterium]|nr:hypothetical protein [Rhodospirillales bacterium]
KLRLFAAAVIVSYAMAGLFERRAINVGNAYSITFILTCLLALRHARFPFVAQPKRVNRHGNGTPDRRAKGTPLELVFGLSR